MRFLTRNIPAACDRRWLPKALLASPFVFAAAFGAPQASAQIATGTVMASTGSGLVTEFNPTTGAMITQLDTTTGAQFTTGSMFDAAGNFFVTDFISAAVTKFDPFGVLIPPFGSGYAMPESILRDAAGNIYVGNVFNPILKFDSSGAPLASFVTATGRSDWIELAADQCTMYFTGEGTDVGSLNVCTNTPGPNFNVAPLPEMAFAFRLLPTGGMLIADTSTVIRLDAAGNQIQTYTVPGTSFLFALNLDPDGTSFWTGDVNNGLVARVDIASGTVLKSFSSSGAPGFTDLAGLSVKGERTVVTLPCGSADAALANLAFPAPGTLTYDISSPTRTLSSIKLVASTNIGSFTLPTVVSGNSATGGSFVKADTTATATFELQATFVNPAFACNIDPIITTLRIKQGHMAEQSFHMIPKSEHFIDVDNGRPGLKSLRIDVNGSYLRTVSLRSGETVRIDASAFMTLANNTLTFTGEGKTGSFANIDVSDSAPASRARVSRSEDESESENENEKAPSVQEKGIWGRMMYEK
jgi:streptogramin lyase